MPINQCTLNHNNLMVFSGLLGLLPVYSLGQNFLVSMKGIGQCVYEGNGFNVYEIGSGHGALTSKLIKSKNHHIKLIEVDLYVAFYQVKRMYVMCSLLTVDVLESSHHILFLSKPSPIVGNISFNIVKELLFSFIGGTNIITVVEFMVQLTDPIEGLAFNSQTTLLGFLFHLKGGTVISPTNFFPKPNVMCSYVTIDVKFYELYFHQALKV